MFRPRWRYVHINSDAPSTPIATPTHRNQTGTGTDAHAIQPGSMTNARTPSSPTNATSRIETRRKRPSCRRSSFSAVAARRR
jgi:hypothetical protein